MDGIIDGHVIVLIGENIKYIRWYTSTGSIYNCYLHSYISKRTHEQLNIQYPFET